MTKGNGTLGSQFTEHQQGTSSALVRAEGEKEFSPNVSVCLSPCPINFISLSTFIHTSRTCLFSVTVSPPLSPFHLSWAVCISLPEKRCELEH